MPSRMPNVMAPARRNNTPQPMGLPHSQAPAYHRHGRTGRASTHANNAAAPASSASSARPRATHTPGTTSPGSAGGTGRHPAANPATAGSINARHGLINASSPYGYTYGSGAGARQYRAYGYGRGYRNRYYGAGYGYGRSQGMNRAIVARLRSVYSGLARLDHDYQGHRVRAMHAISLAIRQLSNRSMSYMGAGFAPGLNNRGAMGMRRSVLAGAGRGGQRLTQAQSDARMGQALRALQGIQMQLTNLGSNTMGQGRARGFVGHAIQELNIALSIR